MTFYYDLWYVVMFICCIFFRYANSHLMYFLFCNLILINHLWYESIIGCLFYQNFDDFNDHSDHHDYRGVGFKTCKFHRVMEVSELFQSCACQFQTRSCKIYIYIFLQEYLCFSLCIVYLKFSVLNWYCHLSVSKNKHQ